MATVNRFLPSRVDFYSELQDRSNKADATAFVKYQAAVIHQNCTRSRLVRKYYEYLSFFAKIIQRAYRMHLARKARRRALIRFVNKKFMNYYHKSAKKIQAIWRGYYSRKTKFCYSSYRAWLRDVSEKSEHLAAEVAEYRLRSRADNLALIEEEARQWLAFVVFKLHHLLRTKICAGVLSQHASNELTEFEKLLKSIRYTEYMQRLRKKYQEFVKKHKPMFKSKDLLFPIIGDGHDYWYLSLPEMYELSAPVRKDKDTRHVTLHHGRQHKQPFLWRKFKPIVDNNRGPFTPKNVSIFTTPKPPASTPNGAGDNIKIQKDPRFHLYVKHYKPNPDVMKYVDFHINILLARRPDIVKIPHECKRNSITDFITAQNFEC